MRNASIWKLVTSVVTCFAVTGVAEAGTVVNVDLAPATLTI